jgi:hypothetical protein
MLRSVSGRTDAIPSTGRARERAAGCGGADQLTARVGERLSDPEGTPIGL